MHASLSACCLGSQVPSVLQWPICHETDGNATNSLIGIATTVFPQRALQGAPSSVLPLLQVRSATPCCRGRLRGRLRFLPLEFP